MATNRKRIKRERKHPLQEAFIHFFKTGETPDELEGSFDLFIMLRDPLDLKPLWDENKEWIIKDFTKTNPGQQAYGCWFD